MIQTIASALQPAWTAGNRNAAVLTERTFAKLGQVLEVQVHIVGHVEIEITIVIVVSKCSAGSPVPGIPDVRPGRHIGESSVAIIVVKNGAIKVSDIKIFPAVIVVVPHRRAKSPATVA